MLPSAIARANAKNIIRYAVGVSHDVHHQRNIVEKMAERLKRLNSFIITVLSFYKPVLLQYVQVE